MGHYFREQEDVTENHSDAEEVPVFVIDTVNEVIDLLHVFYMACADIGDARQRSALMRLQDVIETKLWPLSSKGTIRD